MKLYEVHFLVSLGLRRPAQWVIHAKALAVGLRNNCQMCIGQCNFENDFLTRILAPATSHSAGGAAQ